MTGRFITLEGGEGAGKSTQARLLADWLEEQGRKTVVTREPGGTEGAEAIRELLMRGDAGRWSGRAEALLFAAARSDHVEKVIRPALDAGKWVICDRFLDSSRAYQSGGSGIDDADIFVLHRIGSGGLMPDLTLFLDLPIEQAIERMERRDRGQSDRFGMRDRAFHLAVAAAFHRFTASEPERFALVNGSADAQTVHQHIVAAIEAMTS